MLRTSLVIRLMVRHNVIPGESGVMGLVVCRIMESPIGDLPLEVHSDPLIIPSRDLVMSPVTLEVRPVLFALVATPMNVALAGPAMASRLVRPVMAALRLRLLTIGPSMDLAAVNAGHDRTRPATHASVSPTPETPPLRIDELSQAVNIRVAVEHPGGIRNAHVYIVVKIIMNATTFIRRRPRITWNKLTKATLLLLALPDLIIIRPAVGMPSLVVVTPFSDTRYTTPTGPYISKEYFYGGRRVFPSVRPADTLMPLGSGVRHGS